MRPERGEGEGDDDVMEEPRTKTEPQTLRQPLTGNDKKGRSVRREGLFPKTMNKKTTEEDAATIFRWQWPRLPRIPRIKSWNQWQAKRPIQALINHVVEVEAAV